MLIISSHNNIYRIWCHRSMIRTECIFIIANAYDEMQRMSDMTTICSPEVHVGCQAIKQYVMTCSLILIWNVRTVCIVEGSACLRMAAFYSLKQMVLTNCQIVNIIIIIIFLGFLLKCRCDKSLTKLYMDILIAYVYRALHKALRIVLRRRGCFKPKKIGSCRPNHRRILRALLESHMNQNWWQISQSVFSEIIIIVLLLFHCFISQKYYFTIGIIL